MKIVDKNLETRIIYRRRATFSLCVINSQVRINFLVSFERDCSLDCALDIKYVAFLKWFKDYRESYIVHAPP